MLRYAEAERLFAQPVSLPAGTAEVRDGDRVYGHVIRRGPDTWLQYWLFYADNPQDRSPLRTGRHAGDWELVQVRLDEREEPVSVTFSQHSWAERCDWTEVERSGDAPVAYVANGSHANYSAPGDYDRPFPDPTDEADGEGRQARPDVTPIGDDRPAWVAYDGRWGDSEAGFVPGEASSPRGPRFQPSGVWRDPAGYDAAARPCGSGPPGRPWQTVATAAAAGLVLAGIALLVRRRRSLA